MGMTEANAGGDVFLMVVNGSCAMSCLLFAVRLYS